MDFEPLQILIAFALTLFAGLATGIGSLVAFLTKRTNTRFLSLTLGFSAGVMIYISFMELIPEAREILSELYLVLSFFGGIAFIAVIDFLIPKEENPMNCTFPKIWTTAGAETDGYHAGPEHWHTQFPEGIATFMAGLKSPDVGIPIALAVAMHNILKA